MLLPLSLPIRAPPASWLLHAALHPFQLQSKMQAQHGTSSQFIIHSSDLATKRQMING